MELPRMLGFTLGQIHVMGGWKRKQASRTHQSDEEEEDLEAPAERGHAGDVSVTHRGHGHHQEVHAVPVGQALAVLEVRRVAGILQLWRGNDQNDKWSHLGSDGWELMEQIKLCKKQKEEIVSSIAGVTFNRIGDKCHNLLGLKCIFFYFPYLVFHWYE